VSQAASGTAAAAQQLAGASSDIEGEIDDLNEGLARFRTD
jgi:methyl-accepting chemotaxis protein